MDPQRTPPTDDGTPVPVAADGDQHGAASTHEHGAASTQEHGAASTHERGELVEHPERPERNEAVEHPAKVMRIGSMIKQLLEEVRGAGLDEASRGRLREIYETSVRELAEGLSVDLRDELARLALPFDDGAPSESELRVAQAQLVGWLEGLFHGIQATLFAQQMAARQQLEEMQRRGLPQAPGDEARRPGNGTYL